MVFYSLYKNYNIYMEDDEARLWLFSLLYVGYIMYLNYIQNLSIVRKDWQDMKCNPLFLLLDSFVSTPSQSELSFKKCVIQAKDKQITSTTGTSNTGTTPTTTTPTTSETLPINPANIPNPFGL